MNFNNAKYAAQLLALIILFGAAQIQIQAQNCSTVTFGKRVDTTLHPILGGTFTKTFAVGDFNRDGNNDFAVTDDPTDLVYIFLGDGKGDFAQSTISAGVSPSKVVTADFNRDGKLDLAVNGGSTTTIFVGSGTGTFNLTQAISQPSIDFAIDDHNLDGIPDIISLSGATLRVFTGNGNGTFDNFTASTSISASRITVGDFNRDGKPDAVTASDAVSFFPGNGVDGYGAPTTFTAVQVAVGSPNKIIDGDINGDGRLDVIFIGFSTSNNSRIFLGNNSGIVLSNLINSDTSIREVLTSDFNGDGKIDLGVVKNNSVEMQTGNGSGGFTVQVNTSPLNAGILGGAATGDFNNDGKTDIVAASINRVGVFFNQCGGLTEKPDSDFDGDGRGDLTVFRPSNGTWFTLRSSNNTFFGVQWGASGDVPAAGDYDGDGKADHAVFRPSNGSWFILRSGDGSFLGTAFGQNGDQPAPSDYDGDGKTDICVFRPSNGTWFRLNSSNGQFTAAQFGASGDIAIR